jgi:MFS family permease
MTEEPVVLERPVWRNLVTRVAVDVTPLREFREFRRLWVGQSISFLGGEVTFVALPFQVYHLTGSTLALGLFSLTQLVPLLTLTLVGGAIADAFDRRRMLLVTETAEALAVAGLAVNAALPHPNLIVVFVLATVAAACFSTGVGAMRSLAARLVPPERLVAATALNSVYYGVGGVVGPALAGVLIKFVGLPGAFALDAASFAASVAALWRLPSIPPLADVDRPSLRSIVEGFRFVRRQKVIFGFFLVDTNAMIFGMPLALYPAVADERFGDPTLLGYLYAAPAVGALTASVGSGWMARVGRQGVAVVVAASAWGAAIAAFGYATELWLALVLLGLAGAADQISAIFRGRMVLALTPDELRGRLSGIEFMQVASAPSLGNLEAGVVASLTSLRFSIVSGGIACIVGCIAAALAFPALLRYDSRRHDLEVEAAPA